VKIDIKINDTDVFLTHYFEESTNSRVVCAWTRVGDVRYAVEVVITDADVNLTPLNERVAEHQAIALLVAGVDISPLRFAQRAGQGCIRLSYDETWAAVVGTIQCHATDTVASSPHGEPR
jgi:hypothetical protein